MRFFCIFLPKNLVMSKKSSTFALAFEKDHLLVTKKAATWCGSSVG